MRSVLAVHPQRLTRSFIRQAKPFVCLFVYVLAAHSKSRWEIVTGNGGGGRVALEETMRLVILNPK